MPEKLRITITIMIHLYDHGPDNDHDAYLIKDIFTSHVRCNPNWADGSNDGVKR